MADIFRATSPEYLAQYDNQILASHRKAIDDIILCRTRALGGETYFCKGCDCYQYSYHSCKNRSCPKCGNDDATRWIAAQEVLLLPVRYYLVTVTLPAELRSIARRNQKLIYSLTLKTAAASIQKLAHDPKYVGGEVGIIANLQTWTRDMRYHVHGHFIVTGGGLSSDGKRWLPVQGDFLMPQWPLANLFRGKFKDTLKKEPELYAQIPQKVWRMQWVADVKPVGTGHAAIKYLAPYIFRIAISNKRIIRFENGKVTFKWQDNKDHWHTTTLDAEKFMSRFLQHVLPKGFVKVRYYGFLATRRRDTLKHVKELFDAVHEQKEINPACNYSSDRVKTVSCPNCGRPMIFVAEIRPQRNRSP